jgi:hypothetical protein
MHTSHRSHSSHRSHNSHSSHVSHGSSSAVPSYSTPSPAPTPASSPVYTAPKSDHTPASSSPVYTPPKKSTNTPAPTSNPVYTAPKSNHTPASSSSPVHTPPKSTHQPTPVSSPLYTAPKSNNTPASSNKPVSSLPKSNQTPYSNTPSQDKINTPPKESSAQPKPEPPSNLIDSSSRNNSEPIFSKGELGTRILKFACAGEDVAELQKLLAAKKYDVFITGYFGAKTEQAVIKFQNEHDIRPDGKVDELTLKMLRQ